MAFQCLQLVVTDYLPVIGSAHLEVVVEVAARFGLQTQELNVSLTAIGLLVSFVFVCVPAPVFSRLVFRPSNSALPPLPLLFCHCLRQYKEYEEDWDNSASTLKIM